MSVYIPGMEMPKNCWDCPLRNTKPCPCKGYSTALEYVTNRHADCPLVPVPEHGRLIDADALKVSLVFAEETAEWAVPALRAVLMVIDEMPVIIPADKEGEG